uniref:Uncharacterized protein n=1 Tax=Ditylenchus dipsaci TaxID=166011 RepID=A0A915EP41_9BILA
MTGGDPAISNFDGFDMSEVSGLNRFFSAVITKIGIPFPTISDTPRVLAQAGKLCTNASEIKTLQSGFPITGFVKNQEAFSFRVQMDEKFAAQGVIIQCKSSTMSKFKLVLFDSEGGVRMLKDSQKRKIAQVLRCSLCLSKELKSASRLHFPFAWMTRRLLCPFII